MNVLILINDAPYGTEKAYNAMRLRKNIKNYNPEEIRLTANKFSTEIFRNNIVSLIGLEIK